MNETTQPQNGTQAVTRTEPRAPMVIGSRGLQLSTFDDVWRFSSAVAKSGLAPKGIQTAEAIFVAVQLGMEVGLPPMMALQNIAVINNRPTIYGDVPLGIVRHTGELEIFEEWFEVAGKRTPRKPDTMTDDTVAVCRIKRRGFPERESSFSVRDAKTAGLWGKEGPWRQYPTRMLMMRARAFGLRDEFGDALKGVRIAEEQYGVIDIESVPASETFTPPPSPTQPNADTAPVEQRRGPGRPRKVQSAPESEVPKQEQAPAEAVVGTDTPAAPPPAGDRTHGTLVEEELTPREKLSNDLTAAGYTWDHVVKWNGEMGFLKTDLGTLGGFDDLSADDAEKLWRSVGGLKRQLATVKGGAK